MLHYGRGELALAEQYLVQGLTIRADHAGFLNSYGLLCTKRKQFDLAQDAYEKVIL